MSISDETALDAVHNLRPSGLLVSKEEQIHILTAKTAWVHFAMNVFAHNFK